MITVAAWNVRGLNSVGHQHAVGQLVRDKGIQFLGLLETRVRMGNLQSVRARLLPTWSWFKDYSGPGGRIWLAWNALEVGVEILMVEEQYIHCSLLNKRMHTKCLISVVYGDCDSIHRRQLWGGLQNIFEGITDVPWVPFTLGITAVKEVVVFGGAWTESCTESYIQSSTKDKRDLSNNVCLAKEFLEKAQTLFDMFKEDILLQLVQWCRAIYCKAVELENSMLRQRAKLNWFKHGDQCSNIFFRKINARRAKQRVYQISNSAGDILTESDQDIEEFLFFSVTVGRTET
ncbi:UNVERIFIED_CONTAM: hypothetical protein Slati_2221100 [Sesamum latifolium]|uniref:Uncharacterized protein n=1 Tax=Sesamum latifolium TaxID=2727402 RepID=A0AAW2WT70_9LAMI